MSALLATPQVERVAGDRLVGVVADGERPRRDSSRPPASSGPGRSSGVSATPTTGPSTCPARRPAA
ncbi:MAG: hypothetical protein R2704_08515 [Microthrixaceae bacterium]